MTVKDHGMQMVKMGAWSAGPGCHGGCGVKLFIQDGKLKKIEGDEDHPYKIKDPT